MVDSLVSGLGLHPPNPGDFTSFHQIHWGKYGKNKKTSPFRLPTCEEWWNHVKPIHHPSRGDISLHRSSKSLKGAHALRKLREMVESSPSGPKLLSASQKWPPKLLTSTHHLKTVPSFYLNWNVMKHLYNQIKMRSAIQENWKIWA